MPAIAENLATVQARIAAACSAAARPPQTVGLLAVSKTQPAAAVAAAAAAGQRAFGENYVQEGVDKLRELAALQLEWHFIGPLQSNKTREVATSFDWVHSIDRLKLAERLSAQRPLERQPLQVCVQVNISGEASKSGCAPDDALALCRTIAGLPRLNLRGLMAIPAPATSDADARAPFRALRELFDQIRRELPGLDTISAGMSDDLDAAIAEGSTLVRVGSAIFGARPRNSPVHLQSNP